MNNFLSPEKYDRSRLYLISLPLLGVSTLTSNAMSISPTRSYMLCSTREKVAFTPYHWKVSHTECAVFPFCTGSKGNNKYLKVLGLYTEFFLKRTFLFK